MRNSNFARALTHAQNSGPPLHKILDPPLHSPLEVLICVTSAYVGYAGKPRGKLLHFQRGCLIVNSVCLSSCTAMNG